MLHYSVTPESKKHKTITIQGYSFGIITACIFRVTISLKSSVYTQIKVYLSQAYKTTNP
ncbi:MAG TPA: hypothetical protein PLM81_12505 [Ginsengibacter sp.]|nr:hypothetical protein [Ginsengibacter sp.]HRP45628.1 hypothetical protein [Ginsengibacter sp.]